MMRTILDAGSEWQCNVHPQPTIEDLHSSLKTARPRNVRGVHLTGHSRKKCGFVWNANKKATASREFDVDAVCLLIGLIGLDFAFLNACETLVMGQKLREAGVRCVICWRTPVLDDTARQLSELFYRALVQQPLGTRDYRRAFFAATDALRVTAHTGGAVQPPRSAGGKDSASTAVGTCAAGNTGPDSDMMEPDDAGGASAEARRGKVQDWHLDDVVQFLSQDGDSEPIYLWRKRPDPASPPAAAGNGGTAAFDSQMSASNVLVDEALRALFEQHGLGDVCADVCKELDMSTIGDLAFTTPQDVDDLPKYVMDRLKNVRRRKLAALLGSATAESLGEASRSTTSQPSDVAGSVEPQIWMEQISRFTWAEMKNTWDALVGRSLTREESMVCHYTDIESAKLIIGAGSVGFRASSAGQGGGGFYVVTKGPHEMGWEKYQEGEFRGCVGRELWGDKAADVLQGGRDAAKLDTVFFIKVPSAWLHAAGSVPGREAIKILPHSFLYEKGGHFYLQKKKIVKCYILKKDAPTFCS